MQLKLSKEAISSLCLKEHGKPMQEGPPRPSELLQQDVSQAWTAALTS